MLNGKVVQLTAFRQQQQASNARPCSFSAISDKGNLVYGTAAFLVVAKRNGGVDKFIASIANEAVTVALNNAINGGQCKFGWSSVMGASIVLAHFF